MGTTNLLMLRGNVGQDPRQVGKTVKLSVATNRSWIDAEGERKTVSDWVTVTFFEGKMADFVMRNVHKGDKVNVQARVSESMYQKDGATHYATDVIAEDFDKISTVNASGDQ